MNFVIVNDDLFLVDPFINDEGKVIYFCGDSFYGYYTFDEFRDLLLSLLLRLGELKKEYEGHY